MNKNTDHGDWRLRNVNVKNVANDVIMFLLITAQIQGNIHTSLPFSGAPNRGGGGGGRGMGGGGRNPPEFWRGAFNPPP